MPRKIAFIDLEKEIRALRNNTAFGWVALRSVDLTQKCAKCTNLDPQYSEASISCPSCLGTGHHYIDKLVKGQKSLLISAIDLRIKIGRINTKIQFYYLPYSAKPKTTDFILELDRDVKTGVPKQPFSVRKIYKVTDTQALRGIGGHTKFWRCQIEERNFDRGKSILAKDGVRPDATPSVFPPLVGVEPVAEFGLGINDGILALNGSDFSFPITNLAGEDKKLFLTPQELPPAGEFKYTTLDGTDTEIDLIEI